MDEADFTHLERNRPTVTLLTGNELLGLFFKHFLGEQAQLEVALARLEKIVPGSTDLYLLDSGNSQTEQLSTLLDQLDEQTPVALVNIAPEQAEQLVDKHPAIRGVFYSHATREHLLDGIQVLLEGGDWLPRVLTERLLSQWRRMRQLAGSKPSLTLREREILSLAGKGLSNAEIAEQLCLSPHTIKSHIHNLLRKIGASNRAEAAFLLRGRLDWSESCHA
ncbi:DNA-binding response regulator CorR [Pseudomonas sp. MT-1]|jgi:DNA-binding NarL/FixJ family response regulator|nr:DNA-binding response regulator CorR [Pseudomonas sp. MT-1]